MTLNRERPAAGRPLNATVEPVTCGFDVGQVLNDAPPRSSFRMSIAVRVVFSAARKMASETRSAGSGSREREHPHQRAAKQQRDE
jgi:hypothetical protein